MSGRFLVSLLIANIALFAGYAGVGTILLPRQVELFSAAHRCRTVWPPPPAGGRRR